MNRSPFDAERDEELGGWLREAFSGPDQDRFFRRLGVALDGLPLRRSAWDELAGWGRPRVLAAAVAAGFVLGTALFQGWRDRSPAEPAPSVAAALFEQPIDTPILYAVLGDEP